MLEQKFLGQESNLSRRDGTIQEVLEDEVLGDVQVARGGSTVAPRE